MPEGIVSYFEESGDALVPGTYTVTSGGIIYDIENNT